MSKKFKVGDLVTGVANSKYSITNINMIVGRVEKADDMFMDVKILKHKNCNYVGNEFSVENSDKLFKLVNEVIVVYREGDTVIAHNKLTDKKGIAKCSPEDTFDFNIGAKLAFERLMTTRRIVKLDKYEIGDKVKIVDAWTDKTGENYEGLMDKYLGTVMTIRDITQKGKYKMHEDKTDFDGDGWFWNEHCIEGKVVEVTEVKEVKRHAKVGEYIKIVKGGYLNAGHYEVGDILKVTGILGNFGDVRTINLRTNKPTIYIDADEYVVLEGYVPKEEPKEEVKEEPKEPPFKPGDLVVLTEARFDIPKGAKAYVVKVDDDNTCFLDFCVEYEYTHKGSGDYELKEPTGRWVDTSNFEKVNK